MHSCASVALVRAHALTAIRHHVICSGEPCGSWSRMGCAGSLRTRWGFARWAAWLREVQEPPRGPRSPHPLQMRRRLWGPWSLQRPGPQVHHPLCLSPWIAKIPLVAPCGPSLWRLPIPASEQTSRCRGRQAGAQFTLRIVRRRQQQQKNRSTKSVKLFLA